MKSHSYVPQKAKIIERKLLCDDTVGLKVQLIGKKNLSFVPGQFVLLSVAGFGEVPIGLTTSPDEKGYFELAIRSVGMVTEHIWGLTVGDEVGINGPFGNGFPLPALKGRDVVLVTGGLGLAPLRSLIHHIERNPKLVKSLTILSGARKPEKLLFNDEYENWRSFARVQLCVDDCRSSWNEGVRGQITALFNDTNVRPGSVIIACGPPVMFPSIVSRYGGKRVAESDIYFLLERRMKCGIGKCQHCTCGKEYVCLDGPVFSYERLKYNKEAFV